MPTKTEIIEAGAEAIRQFQIGQLSHREIQEGFAGVALEAMLPLIKAQLAAEVEKVVPHIDRIFGVETPVVKAALIIENFEL